MRENANCKCRTKRILGVLGWKRGIGRYEDRDVDRVCELLGGPAAHYFSTKIERGAGPALYLGFLKIGTVLHGSPYIILEATPLNFAVASTYADTGT
jgi:hypothetical protein